MMKKGLVKRLSRLLLVELCRETAYIAHDEQFRRDGKTPYIRHVERVVSLVGEDEELQCIAWLHDVVEDSDYTIQDLHNLEIPKKIIFFVDTLTHRKNYSYTSYINEIKIQGIENIIMVKIADIVANLSDKPTNKQIEKYYKALCILYQ